jgi:hypothetical protein
LRLDAEQDRAGFGEDLKPVVQGGQIGERNHANNRGHDRLSS